MPFKMGSTVHSVVIGHSVYVGGGDAPNNVHDMCTVMKLDLQRNEWTKLPLYSPSTTFFAMTSFSYQLVSVGGLVQKTHEPTNQIAVFTSGRWTNPYPPMNTARYSSTAVCYNKYIIVAGGHDDEGYTSSVEVLYVPSLGWYYIAESLPKPRYELKSTLIGNTLYLMGGWDHTGPTKVVHKVDLNELITKAVSKQATPTLWQVTSDTPLEYSAPLNVGGSLLAVGGWDDYLNRSSSIHLYQPDTRRWVNVGDLPTAQYNCTCSVLPNGEVIVAGGNSGLSCISTVDFLSISNAS